MSTTYSHAGDRCGHYQTTSISTNTNKYEEDGNSTPV